MEFKIGNVLIKNQIVLAPMAGISNTSYRKIIKEMGAGLIFAEMVSDKAIMYGNEKTFEPVNYFFKVPKNIEKKEVFLLDPMLATGGSAIDAINLLKAKGVKKIKFLCIISAPEGLKAVTEEHPDVTIYTAHIDKKLNKNKYICPGLGDAGDRIYGTK